MPHNRYYIDSSLDPGKSLLFEGDEWHHFAHVLRGREGDKIELVNGRGKLAIALVEKNTKRNASLIIETLLKEEPLPPPLILSLALSRMSHLEWALEKGTELGATAFWLFPGNLSEKTTYSPSQQARLSALTLSAMKQCGRLDLPEILYKPKLDEWIEREGTLLFGDTEKSAPYLWELPLKKPLPSPVIFFVGPEKGFDQKEIAFLKQTLFAKGVKLHPHTLRAETAPLVALSQLQLFC